MAELEGADSHPEDLSAVRAEYEAAMGKKPFPGWDVAKLREKMAAGPHPQSASPPPPSEPADTVRVMLLCNHVFLPNDPTQAGWETSSDTRRYDGETDGRRTKLDVHPELAEFLQSRKQAEIL